MIIAGKIICSKDLSNSRIIVDIIHPTSDWEYCDLVGRKELKSVDKSFSFNNVFPGRVTLLRIYEKQARSFLDGLSSAWRNWFHYIRRYYREIKWTRLRDVIYLFSFKKFFIDVEVYHISPLLNYDYNLEIEISKEDAQEYYSVWTEYFPCFGGDFIKHYYNCNNDEEYQNYVNRILEQYSKSILKNISKSETNAEIYNRMFKDEILWVGIKWKLPKGDDVYIKPLR